MEWATVAELGTAAGTLVLAAATFASVRSSNRSAQLAEKSLLAQIRPLLLPSRLDDPMVKIGFQDDYWLRVEGGRAGAEVGDNAVYLGIALRNVGTGLAVLNGWVFQEGRVSGVGAHPPPLDSFRRLTRDLYVPPNDVGFWQGALRDPSDPVFEQARRSIKDRDGFTVDVLYSDADGGQRVVTRFAVIPVGDDDWMGSVGRHWNIDRADPR